jgi:pimeloyl-ACP methyl ester carboxylesterase
VIIHSGGLKREHRGRPRDIPSWGGWLLRLVPPPALHRFLRWMAADQSVVDEALETRFVDLWRREGNRDGEVQRLRQFEATDAEAVLARVRAPSLVLWGEANPQVPLDMAQRFKDALTGAQSVAVRTWPGAGHLLPIERPRETAEAVRDFVRAAHRATP